jgi:hypothetical protein
MPGNSVLLPPGGSVALLVVYPDLMVAVAVMAIETTCDLGSHFFPFLALFFGVQVAIQLVDASRSFEMAWWVVHQPPAS